MAAIREAHRRHEVIIRPLVTIWSSLAIDLAQAVRNVRDPRERRKLTQEDLEGLTRLRRSNISEMERGRRNPALKAIGRIAAAMAIRPEMLIVLPAVAVWPPPARDGCRPADQRFNEVNH